MAETPQLVNELVDEYANLATKVSDMDQTQLNHIMQLLRCLNPIIEAIRQNEVDPPWESRRDEMPKADLLG